MKLGVFKFTQALLRDNPTGGKVKIGDTKYLKILRDEYFFGIEENGFLKFTFANRLSLIETVRLNDKLDLLSPYPDKKSRENIAKGHKDEKLNSYPVSRDFVLINTLNKFHLNGLKFAKTPFTSLGLSIKAHEIISIEHRQIVLVENLTLMANLEALRIPDSLKEALWVYRGDVKPGQQTGMAYEFFRRFNTHKLICFSDLDPAGIQIAISSGASYWLTPSDCELAIKLKQQLAGVEQEWMNQTDAKTYLETQEHLPKQCNLAFDLMKIQHHTLQQEHMLEHKLLLSLFEL
ncbi:hypothetical protein HWQ46_02395 [Shewanella sp. D64]|uniref:DUF7281 domain-containing protein n=1 Tax=unclassified Shewanella TaxID=196818 RepID=UPI0022BA4272|nr:MULTISPECIES: hypothetical protein [unclassified Shewanella]MEC4724395.1 hypothetical protein [Shewanella sp. D64]MEC4736828.1 hypothetical protein [Shewanella sp. E94]WBJ94513.1 hypothetical protein HWQ47_22040 [Shewanella sp. MTB7]